MLGYTTDELEQMVYGIESADLIINADEHPAIHNCLVMVADFLKGLEAEGYFE